MMTVVSHPRTNRVVSSQLDLNLANRQSAIPHVTASGPLPRPRQALRRRRRRGRARSRGAARRVLRPARAQRRRQDDDHRDPRRAARRPTPARSRCSAERWGQGAIARCASGSAFSSRRRSSPTSSRSRRPSACSDRSTERGRTVDEVLALVELDEKRDALGRQALGRAEAAAGGGLRAGRRSGPAVPRRADDRPRSAVAPPAVGRAASAVAPDGRHDPADDPLHGRGRAALRSRRRSSITARSSRSARRASSSLARRRARRRVRGRRRRDARAGGARARCPAWARRVLEDGVWSLATSEVHLARAGAAGAPAAEGAALVASHHAQRDARGRVRRADRKAPARCVIAAAPIHRCVELDARRGCASSCASRKRCSGSSCFRS